MNPKFDNLVSQINVMGAGWETTPLLVAFLNDERVKPRLLVAPASTAHRFHHANEGGLLDHMSEMLYFTQSVLESRLFTKAAQATQSAGEQATYYPLTASRNTANWKSVPSIDVVLAVVLHDIHKIGDAAGRPRFEHNILAKGGRSDAIPWKTCEFVNCVHDQIPLDYKNASLVQARTLLERNREDLPDGEYSLALVSALAASLYSQLSADVLFAIRHHDGAYGRARRELVGNETPLMLMLHFVDMWSSRMSGAAHKASKS